MQNMLHEIINMLLCVKKGSTLRRENENYDFNSTISTGFMVDVTTDCSPVYCRSVKGRTNRNFIV